MTKFISPTLHYNWVLIDNCNLHDIKLRLRLLQFHKQLQVPTQSTPGNVRKVVDLYTRQTHCNLGSDECFLPPHFRSTMHKQVIDLLAIHSLQSIGDGVKQSSLFSYLVNPVYM